MATAPKLATYDDLLALPEGVRAELLGGQITTQPSPLPRHSHVQASLTHFIGGPFGRGYHNGPGGWWILQEVDVRFASHDVTSPDHAGWRRARLPDPWGTRPIEVVPDWICEVLSPSNERHDRVYKMALHARHRVPHYWLINPETRILEAYALKAGEWSVIGTYDDTAVARIAPFEAMEIPLTEFFPPAPEPA